MADELGPARRSSVPPIDLPGSALRNNNLVHERAILEGGAADPAREQALRSRHRVKS